MIAAHRHPPAPGHDQRERLLSILCNFAEASSPAVLLVGGPGCSGKTYFAGELAGELQARGRRASIFSLDCYLEDRARRLTPDGMMSGYNPGAYRLARAARDLAKLKAGRAVRVRPYDQRTGARGPEEIVRSAPFLIVEGSMALSVRIRPLGSLAIYFDAPEPVLYANRLRREADMGFSRAFTDWKYQFLKADYPRYIAPQAARADLVVQVNGAYGVTRIARPVRGAIFADKPRPAARRRVDARLLAAATQAAVQRAGRFPPAR